MAPAIVPTKKAMNVPELIDSITEGSNESQVIAANPADTNICIITV